MKVLQEGPFGALVLAVVSTAGIVVLAALGHAVPPELTAIAAAGAGGALGITNPTGTASAPASTTVDQAGGNS